MDPISDMFVRIRNSYRAGHESVIIPYSGMKAEIARVLKEREFIKDIEKKGKKVKKFLELILLYNNGTPALSGVKRISKASRRMYAKKEDIMAGEKRRGTLIISTPKGVMTGSEAVKAGVGGEIIARVW